MLHADNTRSFDFTRNKKVSVVLFKQWDKKKVWQWKWDSVRFDSERNDVGHTTKGNIERSNFTRRWLMNWYTFQMLVKLEAYNFYNFIKQCGGLRLREITWNLALSGLADGKIKILCILKTRYKLLLAADGRKLALIYFLNYFTSSAFRFSSIAEASRERIITRL